MRRIPLLLTTLLIAAGASGQTVIQLFSENFNAASNQFLLNTNALGGPLGANEWIVNNDYTGQPVYPNTPNQDSIVAGQITGAPFSRYLHIHNKLAVQKNANWDPGSSSDNFVEIGSGFCTKAMTEVKMSFFWLAEGSADAYGEVYYSINGGAWTKTGQAKYNNQNKWVYELLQDPAWEDQEDLRFAFRWVNPGGGGTANNSFAIDDVIAVGTYDEVNNPVTINITNVTPNPVCRDGGLIVFYSMSDTLCFGQYRFELSGPGCNWSNPVNLGFININQYTATGAVVVNIPAATTPDPCYCVRMVRVAPTPVIVGQASACFEVEDCPHWITTSQPVVTMVQSPDDSVCVNSVIDVPFNSDGVYGPGNTYTAQLSDAFGNFDSLGAPFTIGTSLDDNNYPSIPQGNVSGIIPDVPDGCGYMIRVVSDVPPVVGSPWGPFCIKHCDILTNDIMDISLCIDETDGDSTQICLDINEWNTNAQYFTGNQFTIEVHSSMTFAVVNVGGLGATFDTVSGCFTIYAPPLPQLLAMGLAPGMYYIRIIATNSNVPYDLLGSLVRLTIGAPSEIPPVAINPDSVICTNDISCFTVSPYNPNSQYQWQSPNLSNNQPFMWPGSTLCVNFNNFWGTFRVRVRELNFGCWGPWSGYAELTVLGVPSIIISGPIRVCVGDTIDFSVPFAEHTYFEWDADGGIIADTTNDVAQIFWTQPGTYTLSVLGVNPCASDTGYKLIKVEEYPDIAAGPDTTICAGQPVTLSAFGDADDYQWLEGLNLISQSNSVTVNPSATTTYIVQASNSLDTLRCTVAESVTVTVQQPPEETDSVTICDVGHGTLDAGEVPPGSSYLWSTGETSRKIDISNPGLYTVEITIPGELCPNIHYFPVGVKPCNELIFIPNAFSPNNDGTNETFFVVGTNAEFIEMRIYNRWGELIYETTDIDAGWNGTYKGEPVPIGVYTYVVRYLDPEDKEQVASGNVSLLR